MRIFLLSLTLLMLVFPDGKAEKIIWNEYSNIVQLYNADSSNPDSVYVTNPDIFAIGDTVLFIKMKGVETYLPPDSRAGKIRTDKVYNAGIYVLMRVIDISWGVLTFSYPLPDMNPPIMGEMTQLVKVRGARTIHIPANDTLTCKPWNYADSTGGVLVLMASESIILDGAIDVSGRGFHGGDTIPNEYVGTCVNTNQKFFFESGSDTAGYKGEGIIYEGFPYMRGKGFVVNAGGGGNGKYSGGAGGGNLGQGGTGGYESEDCGNFNLGAEGGYIEPFLGGSIQSYLYSNTGLLNNRIFMGGGGGAGTMNRSLGKLGTKGGNGGGIIILITNTLYSNDATIAAKGESVVDTATAGAGGGGGGGVVVLSVERYVGTLNVDVSGGNGGWTNDLLNKTGPGGFGGGGVVWHSSPSPPTNVVTNTANGLRGEWTDGAGGGDGYGAFSTSNYSGQVVDSLILPTRGISLDFSTDTLIDERDGAKYNTVRIGDQWWMAKNLDYYTPNGSWYYNDDSSTYAEDYGRLFDWATAMDIDAMYNSLSYTAVYPHQGVCPSSWHLPVESEWQELIDYLGGWTIAGGKMKETGLDHWDPPNNGATNESGFTAVGAGYKDPIESYVYFKSQASFYSSTDNGNDTSAVRSSIENGNGGIYKYSLSKNHGYSIRCLKDTDPLHIYLSGTNATSIAGSDGSIDLSVNGGKPPYFFHWSNGSTDENIQNLTAGVYKVTVTDSRDSTVTDSIRIYDSFEDERNGQRYRAVKIGEQIWMADNLNIGEYVESITTESDHSDVSENGIIEKYCYNNDISSCSIYGGLYDWNEMMMYSGSDSGMIGITQGICPTDWHLPTDMEWKKMEEYLGMSEVVLDSTAGRGTIEGGKLKETGTELWSITNIGATNETGFSAIPGGYRDYLGHFAHINNRAYFWSSTANKDIYSWYRVLHNDTSNIHRYYFNQARGFSVRCIMNQHFIDSLELSKEDVTCYGGFDGMINLEVFGKQEDYTYNWSNGETTQDISNIEAGWYKVTVADDFGFTMTDSIQILQPVALIADITDSINITCYGESDGMAIVTPSGGTVPYNYLWNDGIGTTDSIVTGLIANKWYLVDVTDANSCTVTDSVFLSQPEPLMAEISDSTNIVCYGFLNGRAIVTPTGGMPPYLYHWNDDYSTTDSTVNGLVANRDYHVNVTDANGCTVKDSVNLSQPDKLQIQETIGDISCYGLCNGSIMVNVSGGTYPYSYNWSEPLNNGKDTLNNLCPGIDTLEVIDNNGCSEIKAFEVQEPDSLNLELTATTICYNDSSGVINSEVSGGIPPYHYLWNNSLTTKDISGLKKGIYTLIVTDANNCVIITSDSIGEYQQVITSQITGHTNVVAAGIYIYSVNEKPASIFTWTVDGGNIVSGQGTNFINVQWGQAVNGLIYVIEKDEHECTGDTVSLETVISTTGLADSYHTDLRIYPNPASERIEIEYPNPENKKFTLILTNLAGKVVYCQEDIFIERIELPRGDLLSGLYIIEIKGPTIFRGKLMIE